MDKQNRRVARKLNRTTLRDNKPRPLVVTKRPEDKSQHCAHVKPDGSMCLALDGSGNTCCMICTGQDTDPDRLKPGTMFCHTHTWVHPTGSIEDFATFRCVKHKQPEWQTLNAALTYNNFNADFLLPASPHSKALHATLKRAAEKRRKLSKAPPWNQRPPPSLPFPSSPSRSSQVMWWCGGGWACVRIAVVSYRASFCCSVFD